jgi:hypothetical protein
MKREIVDNQISYSEYNIRKKRYDEHTVYIMSYVKIPESTPAGMNYGFVAVGFIIDYTKDIVIDSSITFISDELRVFFKDLTVGFNMKTDIEELISIVKRRFIVASLKGVCVAIKDIDKKYKQWKYDNFIQ